MSSGSLPRTPAKQWLLYAAGWTVAALFIGVHEIVLDQFVKVPSGDSALTTLRLNVTCGFTWVVLTPLLLRLAWRYPLTRGRLPRNIAVHVVLSVGVSTVALTLFILADTLLGGPGAHLPFRRAFRYLAITEFHAELLRYWAAIGIAHGITYYRRWRERELAASQLRAELAEARLEVLKRQLQPHFLFNTLNSISVLMFEDPTAANAMLLRLSDLLRAGLATSSPHEISLGEELQFLQRYVDIEKMRFGERLRIDFDVEPSALGARVPNLILQPLVENAIRYGVAALDRPATVCVRAARDGGELVLQVRDDGPGLPKDAKRGIGLTNTEARLKQLYGSDQKFELRSGERAGVIVDIAIPFRMVTA